MYDINTNMRDLSVHKMVDFEKLYYSNSQFHQMN